MKSPITSHVLDTATGKPAANLSITLFKQKAQQWQQIKTCLTNEDGRVLDLLPADAVLQKDTYKLHFALAPYFELQKIHSFNPFAEVVFNTEAGSTYHIPLLVSPFSYSTYRGS